MLIRGVPGPKGTDTVVQCKDLQGENSESRRLSLKFEGCLMREMWHSLFSQY
jgi:hypothetical protein